MGNIMKEMKKIYMLNRLTWKWNFPISLKEVRPFLEQNL